MINTGFSGKDFIVLFCIAGLLGWAVIEFLSWLFSHISWT